MADGPQFVALATILKGEVSCAPFAGAVTVMPDPEPVDVEAEATVIFSRT